MVLVLDWLQAEQPGDLVRQAVDSLRAGGLVLLPTEAGPVVAANAMLSESVDRLAALSAGQSRLMFALPDDARHIADILPTLEPVGDRLTRRCWPGPVAIAFPAGDLGDKLALLASECAGTLSAIGSVAFWCPSHTAAQAVLLAADFPMVFREVGPTDVTDDVGLPGALSAALVAGPWKAGPATVVLIERNHWRMDRPGVVPEEMVARSAARWIVFVCTGNTCRSPMAEALCKHRLAERLGCAVAELPSRGYNILSAGVAAYPDDCAAPEAVRAMQPVGADLTGHRSRVLTETLTRQADDLVAMTRGHLMAVLGRYPATPAAFWLLCGAEGDLDDPIGAGPDVYEACARTITRHVDRLIKEWTVR